MNQQILVQIKCANLHNGSQKNVHTVTADEITG